MLELYRVVVVPNEWGPVYHVTDQHHRTFKHELQLDSFFSIDEAVAFAREHGEEPEVPEETRLRWAHCSQQDIDEYRQQCPRYRSAAS